MTNISNNFTRQEFACKCGCGFDTVDVELLNVCEFVRSLNKGPVKITSGCRCEKHNKAVGGAASSQHRLGRAADLIVTNPQEIYLQLNRAYPNRFGLGLYHTFIHVDTRSGYARWNAI